jgi:hypothetical protein
MVEMNPAQPLIISCSYFYEGWQKLDPGLTANEVQWVFYDDRPIYFWEKIIRRPMCESCMLALG